MPRTIVAVFVFLCLYVFWTPIAAAADWRPPADWTELGTVSDWMTSDAHFMRIDGLTVNAAAGHFDLDQRAIYEQTRRHVTRPPRLDLAEFLALPADGQAERRALARSELRLVRDFRLRLADLVMRIQGQVDVAWGTRVSDAEVVGELLTHLQAAVDLDPGQVYAWHLLAYLSTVAGDELRALDALDGLDAALTLVPDDALPTLRRRAALDRAWLLRDRGYFAQAGDAVSRAVALGGSDRESLLLRGLMAAQTGDTHTAFRVADELDGADVHLFQVDWEAKVLAPGVLDPLAWPTRPSGYLKAWVLALVWLREGNTALATKAFPELPLRRYYPLGDRFWNEAGVIFEATGRRGQAQKAWSLALLCRPFLPYLLYKPYGLDLAAVNGRAGDAPFALGYDENFLSGSRLAYGSALVSQAAAETAPDRRQAVADRAVTELEICLRSGLDTAPAALMLGHAQALLGSPFEMLRAADRALAALARPEQDQTSRVAVEKLRRAALTTQQAPGMDDQGLWRNAEPAWDRAADPQTVLADLRRRREEQPDDGAARRALARFLLRHGDPVEGALLAESPLAASGDPSPEDLLLVLEVDRLRNDPVRAEQLLRQLRQGRAGRWTDPRLWTMVGLIGADHGLPDAHLALERALELDPGNVGLRAHLKMFPD